MTERACSRCRFHMHDVHATSTERKENTKLCELEATGVSGTYKKMQHLWLVLLIARTRTPSRLPPAWQS